jgi:hypothetical protein
MNNSLGYADPNYAYSLGEFGKPRHLSHCGGWILERFIPGTTLKDATGCYPLFSCMDWTKLHEDFKILKKTLISLTIVPDPLANFSLEYLQQNFDIVRPFKTHFISDLKQSLDSFVSKRHRHNAHKSLKLMDVEICLHPLQYIEDWLKLYNNLIRRHNISGINAFSRHCFEIQLNIPGMIMVIGRQQGKIIGAMLILIQNNIGYAHLSSFSEEGYKMRASYGLHWESLTYLLENGIRYVHFGGAAGTKDTVLDGLSQFKQGWSNEHRLVYLCGRIFDQNKYDNLCKQNNTCNENYFPAYRFGEYRDNDNDQL